MKYFFNILIFIFFYCLQGQSQLTKIVPLGYLNLDPDSVSYEAKLKRGTELIWDYSNYDLYHWDRQDSTWENYRLKSVEVDYSTLRSTPGSRYQDKIVVKDFQYDFGGNNYTTKGGVFYKDTVGIENGGTVIVANDGTIWKRVWNEIVVLPEYWEVGGYDLNGNTYDVFSSGNGIANDNERIIAASILKGSGSTISLQPDKPYDIYEAIPLHIGQKIEGNNALLRASDIIKTVLTANVTAGATTISVADASIFRIGWRIGIQDINSANPTYFDQNDGDTQGSITNIVGNNISLSSPIVNTMSLGDTVFLRRNIIKSSSNQSTSPNENYTIQRTRFDGNKASNNLTIDWRYNTIIALNAQGGNALIDQCMFQDNPSENIVISKGTISNCTYENINGSFVHISSVLPKTNVSTLTLDNCRGDGSNINPAGMSHAESVVTFSVNTFNLNINNCHFYNGGGSIVGSVNALNFDVMNIIGGVFKNHANVIGGSASTVDDLLGNILIQGAKFYNCNEFNIIGQNTLTGYSLNKIILSNNIFINTRVFLREITQISVNHNRFEYNEDDYTLVSPFDGNPPNYNQPSWFTIYHYDRVNISNNTITGPRSYNSNIQYGLSLVHGNKVRKTSLGVDTEFFYGQDVVIRKNTISNFKYGIFAGSNIPIGFNTRGIVASREHVGVTVEHNTIFMGRDTLQGSSPVGIFAEPGVLVNKNTIYSELGGYGIVGVGVNDDNNQHQRLMGAKVTGNWIHGAGIYLGGNGNNHYNLTCVNNFYSGTFTANTTTTLSSIIQGNYKIDSINYPQLTSRTIPIYQDWKENSDQY